jgi:spore coat polysaccharide biosynthesis protein SpsF (cytidylyltransferase family)
MNIGGIILARADSTRLPGKQLRLFSGRPLLDWLRLRLGASAGPCVLATTDRPVDDPLADYAAMHGLACYRGDVHDVAGRVLGAAEAHRFTHFFRLNGDSPCVAPQLFEAAQAQGRANPQLDFVTNLNPRSYPYGVACEFFRTEAFRAGYSAMTEANDREHVTPFFYERSSQFRYGTLPLCKPARSDVRLTVDTEWDALFFEQLLHRAGDRWSGWTITEMIAAASRLRSESL